MIDEMGEQKNVSATKCETEGSTLPPTIQRCNYDIPCSGQFITNFKVI